MLSPFLVLQVTVYLMLTSSPHDDVPLVILIASGFLSNTCFRKGSWENISWIFSHVFNILSLLFISEGHFFAENKILGSHFLFLEYLKSVTLIFFWQKHCCWKSCDSLIFFILEVTWSFGLNVKGLFLSPWILLECLVGSSVLISSGTWWALLIYNFRFKKTPVKCSWILMFLFVFYLCFVFFQGILLFALLIFHLY